MSLREGSPGLTGSSPTRSARQAPAVGLPSAQIREESPKVRQRGAAWRRTPWTS